MDGGVCFLCDFVLRMHAVLRRVLRPISLRERDFTDEAFVEGVGRAGECFFLPRWCVKKDASEKEILDII